MQTKQHWRLRHWIIAGYMVPILALIFSAVATVMNVNTVSDRSNDLRLSSQIDTAMNDLAFNTQVLSKTLRGYLLAQKQSSLELYLDARETTDQLVAELRKLDTNPQDQQRISQIVKLLDELNAVNAAQIELVQQGKPQQAIESWRKSDARQTTDEITALMQEMKQIQDALAQVNTQQQDEALSRLKMTVFVATGVSLLCSALLGFWVIQQASRQMTKSAAAIAASATEIAATIEQQERIANQQAISVNETTTTMDELGASSRQSAEQVEAAAISAEQALGLSGNGTKAVHQTLNGMTNLREKVEAITDQILQLSEQTNQIGMISGLVGDLANQTNMLALNAAVEAVRAGEHGKGFAVVAAEIRKLADESKKSAQKIGVLVSDIQAAIRSTVIATDEGTKTVEEGVRIAEETSESFSGVVSAVNTVTINSQQISLNIKQQAIAIDQVVQAMNSLNLAAKESASGVSQIKTGIHQLNQAALDLKAIV